MKWMVLTELEQEFLLYVLNSVFGPDGDDWTFPYSSGFSVQTAQGLIKKLEKNP